MLISILFSCLFNYQISRADCDTKVILDEDSNYLKCELTIDGKKSEQKLTETACVQYCDLQKSKDQLDSTFENSAEFGSHFQDREFNGSKKGK